MADLLLEDGHREELLAAGILGILSPAVEQVDQKISEVRCVCVCIVCVCENWCHVGWGGVGGKMITIKGKFVEMLLGLSPHVETASNSTPTPQPYA